MYSSRTAAGRQGAVTVAVYRRGAAALVGHIEDSVPRPRSLLGSIARLHTAKLEPRPSHLDRIVVELWVLLKLLAVE